MEKFLRECVIMALIKLGLPETGAFSIPQNRRIEVMKHGPSARSEN